MTDNGAAGVQAVVTALFVKPVPHEPMIARPHVRSAARNGLVGDCHAQPLGPRQVLVVRQEALDELSAAAWQVRANIAVSGLRDEDLESGSVLHIGADAQIRITHECEICKVLREYVDRETFRRLPGRRGSLGVFLAGGAIAMGDVVTSKPTRYPRVPDMIGERVAWVVERIPRGRVLTYDTLLTLVGGKRAHFRVMPVYLRRSAEAGLPAHRVLDSTRHVTRHVEDQRPMLAAEGVEVDAAGGLIDADRLWDGRAIYWRKS